MFLFRSKQNTNMNRRYSQQPAANDWFLLMMVSIDFFMYLQIVGNVFAVVDH